MIQLTHGNALECLQQMDADEHFDAIISDPPYSSGASTFSRRAQSTAIKYTGTKRHCPLPDFEGDAMDQRSWADLMTRILTLARRHATDGAVIALFVDWRQLPVLTDVLQWAGWVWRGVAVWDKMSSRPQRGRFRQQAEFIVWGSNGAMPIDRPVACLPGVFAMANVSNGDRVHQTQKPLELMRQVVRLCVPGGRILDMFCGSGTTLLAAQQEGMDAVGIELNDAIYTTAQARLDRQSRL